MEKIYYLWKKHHLNDMHAGTPRQDKALLECKSTDYRNRCKLLKTCCYEEEPFMGVCELESDFYEKPLFSWLDFSELKADIDEEEVLDWLQYNDYILGYYDSYSYHDENNNRCCTKYIMLDRNSHDCESAPYEDLHEEFLKSSILN